MPDFGVNTPDADRTVSADLSATSAGAGASSAGDHAINVADLVARQAERQPDGIALVQPGTRRRTLTWAELDRQVDAVGSGLVGRGLVAGQRVGLLGGNDIEFVIAYFAALRVGLVAVPLDPQASPATVAERCAETGVRLLLSATELRVEGVPRHPLTRSGLDQLAADRRAEVDSPQDGEALAVLLYTAGTSSRPRAVMLTHRALLAHLDQIASFGVLDTESALLVALPLHHVFALNAVLGAGVRCGASLVLASGFDEPERLLEVVVAEQISMLPVAPALLQRLLDTEGSAEALRGLGSVFCGAAPLSVELRETFTARTGLRVDQGYGLTEAGPGVASTVGADLHGHGHVGRPLPGIEVRIGDGAEPSEPGEIAVRGPNLFSGYWPDGHGGPGADGWFATGDMGYQVDADLYLMDRVRELVEVHGFHVYPAEIEEAIAELAGVRAVAVLGVAGRQGSGEIVAFVAGEGLSVEGLDEHCAARLARFKRPGRIILVESLPHSATGTVAKGRLRRLLDQDPPPTAAGSA